uniref:DUF4220 domain-containing protein n=1 Tax=Oryza barthii TaxID=65489 RepID=A0A0D3F2Z1_9ORYZ
MAVSWPGMVQWWEEWQLRVLALSSLFLQCFLFVSATFRRYRIPALFRTCIWLAYLGSDALAIYGLATLFNRHRKPAPGAVAAAGGTSNGHGRSSMLEVLWAPVFLIHLGGQDTITAYNIEDNELWARHAVAMSSQAAVSVYVFCRSWSGGKVPVRCPVALFVAGFLKMGHRLWALRRASITWHATVSSDRRSRRKTTAEEEGGDMSLENYIRQAREQAATRNIDDAVNINDDGEARRAARRRSREQRAQLLAPNILEELMELFIDFPAPYARRIVYLTSFMALENYDAYYNLCNLLDLAFQFFYTKKNTNYTIVGIFLWVLFFLLGITAVAGFDRLDSNKDGLDRDDVKVTYILLCSAIVMEFSSLVWLNDWNWVPLWMLAPEMHRTIVQFNLIGFAARSRWPTMVMWIATLLGCKNYVNQHWYLEHRSSTAKIIGFIRKDLTSGWVSLRSVADYRRFNDRRGHWTLRREQCYGELGWSVTELPFDEAVLVWHIATAICLHCTDVPTAAEDADGASAAARSMEISNYMMYLLLFQPDMLMPGTQQSLFTVACREIRRALRNQRQQEKLSERELARWLLFSVDEPTTAAAEQGGGGGEGRHLANARRLAGAMMELDADRRLRVIGGVWVEMICYSASRCRGFLHSKSMGVGGEFLTVVWLLLHRMGMEGLADKLQRPELTTGDVQDAVVV